MEDYASQTDSDYTSYWRDWVGSAFHSCFQVEVYMCSCVFMLFLYFSRHSYCLCDCSFRFFILDQFEATWRPIQPGPHFGIRTTGPQPQ